MIAIPHPDWCDQMLLCMAHRQGGRHVSVPWVVHDLNGSTGTIWAEQSPGGAVFVLSRIDGELSAECRRRYDRRLEWAHAHVARLNGVEADGPA